MLAATKQETFSASGDPRVCFSLAASDGVSENSRLGFGRNNVALHQGSVLPNYRATLRDSPSLAPHSCQTPPLPQTPGSPQKPQTPWYQNSCITGALEKGALAVGIDAVGVFSPLLSRGVGNFIGWSGIVATQQGDKALGAFGAAAGITQVGFGLFSKSSSLGNASTALGAAGLGASLLGLSPGVGQAISAVAAAFDVADTLGAVSQCK